MTQIHGIISNHLINSLQREFTLDIVVWKQFHGLVTTEWGQKMMIGVPGMADIGGIIAGGHALQIEVKHGKDKLHDDQPAWESMCKRLEAFHAVFHVKDMANIDIITEDFLLFLRQAYRDEFTRQALPYRPFRKSGRRNLPSQDDPV